MIGRRLRAGEQRLGPVQLLVHAASWAVQSLIRYTCRLPLVEIVVPDPEVLLVLSRSTSVV